MNKFLMLSASLAALSVTVPGAYAADLWTNYSEPLIISSAGYDWSGFYAGVFAGYGAGRATSTSLVPATESPVDVQGMLLGGTVGANAQFGNFVLGVEGDLAWSGVDGSATCAAPAFTCTGSLDWLSSGKLRAGVAVDQVLLFGTAGISAGGIIASVDPAPAGANGTYSSTVWGWTIGGGAEMAVTDAMSIKAEYAYHDFATVQAPVNTIANLGATDIDSSAHTIKLGLNYRF